MRNLKNQKTEVLAFMSFLVTHMECNNNAHQLLKAYNIMLTVSPTRELINSVVDCYNEMSMEFAQKVDYSMSKFPKLPVFWGEPRRVNERHDFVGYISLTKWTGRGNSQRRRMVQAVKLWKEVARITKLANESSSTHDVYEFLGQLTTMYAALYDETLFESTYNWTWGQERLCELGKELELGDVSFFGYLTRQAQGVKGVDSNYEWEYTLLPM